MTAAAWFLAPPPSRAPRTTARQYRAEKRAAARWRRLERRATRAGVPTLQAAGWHPVTPYDDTEDR